jgi:hypothetical protein
VALARESTEREHRELTVGHVRWHEQGNREPGTNEGASKNHGWSTREGGPVCELGLEHGACEHEWASRRPGREATSARSVEREHESTSEGTSRSTSESARLRRVRACAGMREREGKRARVVVCMTEREAA